MDEALPFGSRDYLLMLGLMGFSRGMDFLSTWIATPNLLLEANPLARKLGWKWGAVVNVAVCFLFASWAVLAITISTTSLLVAARNFQAAWVMNTYGEENYRRWMVERVQCTPPTLYLFCLFGQALAPAAVGTALIVFSDGLLVPIGIGLGVVAYAMAVVLYSLLSVWRIRRSWRRHGARFENAL